MITRIEEHIEMRLAVSPFSEVYVEPVRAVNVFLVRPASVEHVDLKISVAQDGDGIEMAR
jgi:hypothetical protein